MPEVPAAARLGGALFRWRSITPLPLIAAGLVLGRPTPTSVLLGAAVTAMGEFIRAWSVAHIGARSRTRGTSVGALVTTGPFSRCRNPIYLGNLLVGAGIIWATDVPLLLPAYVLLFAAQYSLVVAWEEDQLRREHGRAYDVYRARVPRWLPSGSTAGGDPARYGPKVVLRSERSTLIGQALAFAALVTWMFVRS